MASASSAEAASFGGRHQLPHICVIDPRTGRRVKEHGARLFSFWKKLACYLQLHLHADWDTVLCMSEKAWEVGGSPLPVTLQRFPRQSEVLCRRTGMAANGSNPMPQRSAPTTLRTISLLAHVMLAMVDAPGICSGSWTNSPCPGCHLNREEFVLAYSWSPSTSFRQVTAIHVTNSKSCHASEGKLACKARKAT